MPKKLRTIPPNRRSRRSRDGMRIAGRGNDCGLSRRAAIHRNHDRRHRLARPRSVARSGRCLGRIGPDLPFGGNRPRGRGNPPPGAGQGPRHGGDRQGGFRQDAASGTDHRRAAQGGGRSGQRRLRGAAAQGPAQRRGPGAHQQGGLRAADARRARDDDSSHPLYPGLRSGIRTHRRMADRPGRPPHHRGHDRNRPGPRPGLL